MMILKSFLVDTLVEGPFSGAPTMVIFLEKPMDKFKMLSLANELGTSQTVYILLHDQASYLLRFFSRTQELAVGGHGCHAVAHLIYELGLLPPDESTVLLTQDGELLAKRVLRDLTEVRFTAQTVNKMDQNSLNNYSSVMAINPKSVTWAGITTGRAAILAVDNSVNLRRLTPDREKLHSTGATVLALTSLDQSGCDYNLRCFSSSSYFPEHQVNSSIHRCLAPQWGQILNKKRLLARQLSQRGGLVRLEVSDPNFVFMTAKSKTILRADLVADFQDPADGLTI
jgi:predicted PhzF superfamily epimerase YddE/YHI9